MWQWSSIKFRSATRFEDQHPPFGVSASHLGALGALGALGSEMVQVFSV